MIQILESGRNGNKLDIKSLKHISASSVKLYLACPLRFWFKKFLQLPEPTSPATHLGKSVHAALQHYHRSRWRGESHDEQIVREVYTSAFNDPDDAAEYASEVERVKNQDKGIRVVEAYLDSDHAKDPEIPLGVEVQLEEDLLSLPRPVLGYPSGSAFL